MYVACSQSIRVELLQVSRGTIGCRVVSTLFLLARLVRDLGSLESECEEKHSMTAHTCTGTGTARTKKPCRTGESRPPSENQTCFFLLQQNTKFHQQPEGNTGLQLSVPYSSTTPFAGLLSKERYCGKVLTATNVLVQGFARY